MDVISARANIFRRSAVAPGSRSSHGKFALCPYTHTKSAEFTHVPRAPLTAFDLQWWKRLIARLPLEDPQSRRPFPAHPPRTFYPAHGDKTLRQTAANFAAILQTNEAEHSSSHHGTDDSTRPTGTVSRDRARRTEAQNPFADSAAVSWDATAQTLSRTRERKAVPSTSDPSAQTLSRTANPERARAPVPAAPGALRAPLPSREQASRRTVAMDQQPPAPRSPNPERAPPANTLRAPGPLGDQTPAAHSVPPLVPPARSPNLERARPSSPLTASTLRPPLPQRDHRSRHTVALDDMERHVDDVLRSRRSPPVPQARPPVPPPPAVHEEPLRTRSTPPARSAEPERTRPPVPPVPSALRTSPGDAARPPVPPRPHALRPALAPREHASRHTVSMSHDFVVVPPPLAIVTEPPPPRIRAVASQPMLVPTIVPPTPVDSPVSPASLPLPLSPHSRRSASFSDARVAYNPFVQLMAGQRSPDGEMVPSFESLQLAPAPRRAVSS